MSEPSVRSLWIAAIKEAVLTAPDRVPGARRLITEVTRVELVDRSLAIGAQALLALLPFLVVMAAFTPASVGDALLGSLAQAMGLSAEALGPVRAVTVDNTTLAHDTGMLGFVIALVSATSFSRALQRMYARVFDVAGERAPGRHQASVIWLGGWVLYVGALSLLDRWLSHDLRWPAVALTIATIVHLAFWWWSAHLMLLRRLTWTDLFPAAVITAVLVILMGAGSQLVMPSYARSSVEQFGGFGLILVAATWLVAFGGVLIVACLTGKVLAEQGWYVRWSGRWLAWYAAHRAAREARKTARAAETAAEQTRQSGQTEPTGQTGQTQQTEQIEQTEGPA